MGAGFPMTTCAGEGQGQRCGVYQASLSAAVEAKRWGAETLGLAAVRRMAYYLDRWAILEERDERGYCSCHQCSTPARLGA